MQPLADAVKFIFKEDYIPANVNKWFYLAAPAISLIPALMTFAVIPFGPRIELMGREVSLQVAAPIGQNGPPGVSLVDGKSSL